MCSRTVTWLDAMEAESQTYCTLPQPGTDMAAFLNNFQVMLAKLLQIEANGALVYRSPFLQLHVKKTDDSKLSQGGAFK